MHRIDRLTAILIQLQSKRIVKAQEIAERFEISLRTVYRDIQALNEAGVPIYSEAGVGYSLMEGYRLPPVMFTKEEAAAFLTGEKLMEKLTDKSTEQHYKSAMFKIKSVLKDSEKDFLDTLENHIEVLKNPYLPEINQDVNQVQIFLNSIIEKRVLQITYFASHTQKESNREIEPIGIYYMLNQWHLIAWCQLRNDYRDFRIDRISHLVATDQTFTKQHPTLKKYLARVTEKQELFKVRMTLGIEYLKYLGEQKYYNGYISEKILGNKAELTFLTASLEGFARWFIMFGDRAEIIEPPELKARIKEIASIIAQIN